jgi:hypothetical protein
VKFGFVLYDFGVFGCQWIGGIGGIAEERMVRERPLEPDEEEVGEIRVRDGVVVWWISEPNAGSGGLKPPGTSVASINATSRAKLP